MNYDYGNVHVETTFTLSLFKSRSANRENQYYPKLKFFFNLFFHEVFPEK